MSKPERSETAAPAVGTPLDCGVGLLIAQLRARQLPGAESDLTVMCAQAADALAAEDAAMSSAGARRRPRAPPSAGGAAAGARVGRAVRCWVSRGPRCGGGGGVAGVAVGLTAFDESEDAVPELDDHSTIVVMPGVSSKPSLNRIGLPLAS